MTALPPSAGTNPGPTGDAWWLPGQAAPVPAATPAASSVTPEEPPGERVAPGPLSAYGGGAAGIQAGREVARTPLPPSPARVEPPAAVEANGAPEQRAPGESPDGATPAEGDSAAVWAIVGALLGVAGFALCWVPRLTVFGMVLGGMAILLGLWVGVALLLRRSGGYGFPLASLAVGGQTLALGFLLSLTGRSEPGTVESPEGGGEASPRVIEIGSTGELSIQRLVETLGRKEKEERTEAVTALGKLATEVLTAVPGLTGLLDREEEAEIRKKGVEALAGLGAQARGAYPVVMNLAQADHDEGVRKAAARALEQIGQPTAADVPTLVRGLDRGNASPVYRASVAQVLSWVVQPEMKGIVADLKIAMTDDEPRVRLFAAQALWIINEDPDEVLLELRPGLRARDPSLRSAAAHALGLMRAAARPALTDLLVALEDEDLSVQLHAAQAVWLLERRPELVLPIFKKAMADDDVGHRATAAEILGRMGPAGRDAIPQLLRMLKEDEKDLQARAAFALGRIGPDAAEAVPLLKDLAGKGDLALREQAVYALGGFGPAAKDAVDLLVDLLDEPHMSLRGRAALALAAIGPEGRNAADPLVAALKDTPDPSVRVFLAQALWAVNPPSRESPTPETFQKAIPVLCQVVEKRDLASTIRVAAARVLGQIGPPARMAIPTLLHVQDEDDDQLDQAIEVALLTVGHPTRDDVDPLVKALASRELDFREAVVRTLWLIGPDAHKAVAPLVGLLQEEAGPGEDRAALHLAIVEALTSIGDRARGASGDELKNQLGTLIERFKAEKPGPLRLALVEVFEAVGPEARDAVEPLVESLKDGDLELRLAVCEALGAIGEKAVGAIVDLTALLEEKEPRLLSGALLALTGIGKAAEQRATPKITPLLEHADSGVRLYSAQALYFIAHETRKTTPVLKGLLRDPAPSIRGAAAAVLGGMGPAASDTLSALEELESDPSSDVRRAAKEAVEKIKMPKSG